MLATRCNTVFLLYQKGVEKLKYKELSCIIKMELPDDVLQLVREYAKPSERYKVGRRILAILERENPFRPNTRKELKTATLFYYEEFRQLFLQLEKSYAEVMVALDAVMCDTIYTGEIEYYRKRQDYIFVEYELMDQLYTYGDLPKLECS
jgi:hypothetical protein